MKVIGKSKNMKIVSLLLILVVVLALHPSVNASASGSKTFRITPGNGVGIGVIMEVPDIYLYKSPLIFTCSGVPVNETITSIQLSLGAPLQSGAIVIPLIWTISRVSGNYQPQSVDIPHSQITLPITAFNGQNPNGTWSISFTAIIFRNGIYTEGSISYPNFAITLNY